MLCIKLQTDFGSVDVLVVVEPPGTVVNNVFIT